VVPRRRLLLVALVAIALALPFPAAASRSAEGASARISVALISPDPGTLVPYFGASPLFQWRLSFANPGQRGTIWLEVSATRSFKQKVLQMFDCGYTSQPCVTAYRWRNSQPYWYDLGDHCADLPPLGRCAGLTNVFYWRVRFEPEGGSRKVSSPVGMFRRAVPRDGTAPVAVARAGRGKVGSPDRFFYVGWDSSGVSRAEFQLYDGDAVVYGARNDWDRSGLRGVRYEDLILPASVRAGTYGWCLTVYDYSGNHTTSCASYTLKG
jgi:hypothetical protein